MNASDVINQLIKIGVIVKDAVTKSQAGGPVDWGKAADAILSNKDLTKTVNDLLAVLQQDNVKAAIGEIDGKQKKLLNGRTVGDLRGDELLQYSDLADARLVLATQQLKKSLDQDVVKWLVNDALPVLVDVAPVVIPLLL
jgi:hypothetical protein